MDDQLRVTTHVAKKDDDAVLNERVKCQDVVETDEETEEQSYLSSGAHEHVIDEETSGGENEYEYEQSVGTRSEGQGNTTGGEMSGEETDDEEYQNSSGTSRSNTSGAESSATATDDEEEHSVSSRSPGRGIAVAGEMSGGETDYEDEYNIGGRYQNHGNTTDEETNEGERENDKQLSFIERSQGQREIVDGVTSGEETEYEIEHRVVGRTHHISIKDGMMSRGEIVARKEVTIAEVMLPDIMEIKGQQNENNSAQPDNQADSKSERDGNITGVKTTVDLKGTVVAEIEQQNENNSAQPDNQADSKSEGDGNITDVGTTGVEMGTVDCVVLPTETDHQHESHFAQPDNNELHNKSPGDGNTTEKHPEDNSLTTDHNHDGDKQPLPFMNELKEHFVTEHIGSANQIVINVVGESGEHATLEFDKVHVLELHGHEVHKDIGDVLDQTEQRRKLLEDLIVQQACNITSHVRPKL